MGLLEKLFKEGELPELTTVITVDDASLIKLALALLLVGLLLILIHYFINRKK